MKNTLLFFMLLPLLQVQAQPVLKNSSQVKINGFIENKGQIRDQNGNINDKVAFVYAQPDFHLSLTPSGFSYELISQTPNPQKFPESGFLDEDAEQAWHDEQTTQVSVCRMDVTLQGANPNPTIIKDENTGTRINYYLDNHATENVSSFNRITYQNIYPHIDLVFENKSSVNGYLPEYSFVVHPGGNVKQIRLNYSGQGNLKLDDEHNLSIGMIYGFVKESGLRAYAMEDGSPADVSFQLKNGAVSFNAAKSNGKTLVIDPTIIWGSYFGGPGSENWDTESEIALNDSINVFLTGSTTSASNISTNGTVMFKYGGSRDMFLAKFSKDGSHVEWATYFGGSRLDVSYGVTCDTKGNAIITGFTESPDISNFTTDPLQGNSDVIIAKFSTTGKLMWCHLMGGADDTDPENGRSLICDASDNIYLCGYATSSSNVAQANKNNYTWQSAYAGGGDAILAKYTANGKKVWCTYFSGTGQDRGHALCLDNFGHVYFVGTCQSGSGIVPKNMKTQQIKKGGNVDAFIAKFDTAGTYIWSSYYGGSEGEHGRGVKCDGAGNVYFDGWSGSDSNIASANCFQSSHVGTDAFVAKFTPNGMRIWGTYFGGKSTDLFYGMAIDPQANLYLSGGTASGDLSYGQSIQPTNAGGEDAMLVEFDSSGNRLWASYFGSTADDASYDIETDNNGKIYFNVDTKGVLPVTNNTHLQNTNDDLAVFEVDMGDQSIAPQAKVFNVSQQKEAGAAKNSIPAILNVLPNPATTNLNIIDPFDGNDPIEIGVFDMSSHELLKQEWLNPERGTSLSVNVAQLQNGFYIVTCQQNDIIRSAKIMVSH